MQHLFGVNANAFDAEQWAIGDSAVNRMWRYQLPLPLVLCVICQACYRCFTLQSIPCTAREMLLGGLCAAMAMAGLLVGVSALGMLFSQHLSQTSLRRAVLCALLCLAFAFGALWGLMQQMEWYYAQFRSGVFWVLLCGCAACALHVSAGALVRSARVLLALCALVLVCMVTGLAAQSDWRNLVAQPLQHDGVLAAFWLCFAFYPEYLALLLCPVGKHKINDDVRKNASVIFCMPWRRYWFILLPFIGASVCATILCSTELLFGAGAAQVGGFAFLRCWGLLQLSRFDGVVVLFWLLLSLFRVRFLFFLAGQAFVMCAAGADKIKGRCS